LSTVAGVVNFLVNISDPVTEYAMLPGVVPEGAGEIRAATNTETGSPITHDAGNSQESTEGGQVAHTTRDVPVGLDTCAVADTTPARKSGRGTIISSTLKQAAKTAYNRANSMFRGTRVTNLGAEFSGHQTAQRLPGGIAWAETNHLLFDAILPGQSAEFHERPFYRNPRRGPVAGLRDAIQREEERRGRNLTPEEWQSVRDWCIQRNSLVRMGLDLFFNEE